MTEFEGGRGRPHSEQDVPTGGRQSQEQRKSLRTLVEEGRRLLSETDSREMRRVGRPINLYDTPFEKKLRSLIIEIVEKMASPDTIEDMEFLEEVRERNLRQNEIEVQTSSSLTPDQQERFRIGENILVLHSLKTMPRKIKFVDECLNEEDRDKLQQLNSELMNPIIRRLEQRPARREKAEAAVQRIYERRGEEYPGKPLILFEYDALRILVPSNFPTE
jgi:hypothetical protein